MKNKISIHLINEKYIEWTIDEKSDHLRLGQYLMNELIPSISNSEIYYEENSNTAILKFINEYGKY